MDLQNLSDLAALQNRTKNSKFESVIEKMGGSYERGPDWPKRLWRKGGAKVSDYGQV